MDAIVAPVARARKLGNRHQLQRRHSQVAQRREAGNDGLKGASGCEGSHMEFVKHQVSPLYTRPGLVRPCKMRWPQHGGGAMHAVWLPARHRIRTLWPAVEAIRVALPVGDRRCRMAEVAALLAAHGVPTVLVVSD